MEFIPFVGITRSFRICLPQSCEWNVAYQQIIGMGPTAIPWIIEELEKEPDHWFWALYCLTGGIDPVSTSDRGDIEAMYAAWIEWYKEHGKRS